MSGTRCGMGMGLSLDLRDEAPDDRALRDLGIQARPVSAYIQELVEAETHRGRRA